MRRSWYYAVVGTPHAQLSCDLGVARSQRPERRRYFLRVLKRCRGDTRTLCIGDLVRYPQGMRGKKHTRKGMWCGKTRVACHLENVPAGHLGNALQSVLDGASTISTTAMPVRPMMLPRHCRRWPIHPGCTRLRLHFWYFVFPQLSCSIPFRCAAPPLSFCNSGSRCCVTHCARRTNPPSICTEACGYDCTAYRQRTTRTLWSTARPWPARRSNKNSNCGTERQVNDFPGSCKLANF
jgi:hypothetical protein